MSKKEMSLVYYYIPQDQDDPEYPNVFGVMTSKSSLRLQHIYDSFPLKGSYIFRFKVMYDNTVAWLDLPDLQAKLPTFKEKIFVKVTRVSWDASLNPYGHYQAQNKAQPVANGGNHQPSSLMQPPPQEKPKAKVEIDILGDGGHTDLI